MSLSISVLIDVPCSGVSFSKSSGWLPYDYIEPNWPQMVVSNLHSFTWTTSAEFHLIQMIPYRTYGYAELLSAF